MRWPTPIRSPLPRPPPLPPDTSFWRSGRLLSVTTSPSDRWTLPCPPPTARGGRGDDTWRGAEGGQRRSVGQSGLRCLVCFSPEGDLVGGTGRHHHRHRRLSPLRGRNNYLLLAATPLSSAPTRSTSHWCGGHSRATCPIWPAASPCGSTWSSPSCRPHPRAAGHLRLGRRPGDDGAAPSWCSGWAWPWPAHYHAAGPVTVRLAFPFGLQHRAPPWPVISASTSWPPVGPCWPPATTHRHLRPGQPGGRNHPGPAHSRRVRLLVVLLRGAGQWGHHSPHAARQASPGQPLCLDMTDVAATRPPRRSGPRPSPRLQVNSREGADRFVVPWLVAVTVDVGRCYGGALGDVEHSEDESLSLTAL